MRPGGRPRTHGGTNMETPVFDPLWSKDEGQHITRELQAPDSAVTMAELAAAQLLGQSSNEMLGRASDPVVKMVSDLLAEGTESLKGRLSRMMEAHRRLLVCEQYTRERSGVARPK